MKSTAIAVLLTLLPGLALARDPLQEQCKAVVKDPGGQLAAVAFPGLRLVGHASADALPLPPSGTTLVECGRDSITPTLNDVKVLIDYHVPLSITDGERVAFLEINRGQVGLRMAQGDLTPQERREVASRLDSLQLSFNASNQPHSR